jgi:hypothetical protein
MRGHGLTEKLNLKPILGFSDTETVKLDFDDTPFKQVKYWAFKAMKRFRLGGFLILKSSQNCYHVVFNGRVSWSKNLSVVAWAALLSHNKKLEKFCLMQCIKQSSTLRVSPKKEKPSPRIVFHFGKQNKQVKDFVKLRRNIKKILQKLR